MTKQIHPLSQQEFDEIFAKVPRLTVEVVIRTADGIVMTTIPKGVAAGQWNVPGGTVRFGEHVTDAVRRVARDELGIDVNVGRLLGYIEYPHLLELGYSGWPVGLAFEASIANGSLNADSEAECFTSVPENTIVEQAEFLRDYLAKNPLS